MFVNPHQGNFPPSPMSSQAVNSPRRPPSNQPDHLHSLQSATFIQSNTAGQRRANQNDNAIRQYNNQTRYQNRNGPMPGYHQQQYEVKRDTAPHPGSHQAAFNQAGIPAQAYQQRRPQSGHQVVTMPPVCNGVHVGSPYISSTGLYTNSQYVPVSTSVSHYNRSGNMHGSTVTYPYTVQSGYTPGSPVPRYSSTTAYGSYAQSYPVFVINPYTQTPMPGQYEHIAYNRGTDIPSANISGYTGHTSTDMIHSVLSKEKATVDLGQTEVHSTGDR